MSKSKKTEFIATWPTAWGPMGGVWTDGAGLSRLLLPGMNLKDMTELLQWEHQGATMDKAPFEQLAELCRDYCNRKIPDFSVIECDLSGVGPFGRTILNACRNIPYGQRLTYTQLALKAGEDGKQRAAAQALGRNNIPLVIPCHRVVAAGGLGGFSATGGVELKAKMLEMEKQVSEAGQ